MKFRNLENTNNNHSFCTKQLSCFLCDAPRPTFDSYQPFRAHLRQYHGQRRFQLSEIMEFETYAGAINDVDGLPPNAQHILEQHHPEMEFALRSSSRSEASNATPHHNTPQSQILDAAEMRNIMHSKWIFSIKFHETLRSHSSTNH